MKGVTIMVSNLSFLFSIFRALMMAGTAHAKPPIIGITLLPFKPTLLMILSERKLILAMYPVSSNRVIKPNNIMICGTKTSIPPNPARIPLTTMSAIHPSGKTEPNHPPKIPTPDSIRFIGYSATQNTDWNRMNNTTPMMR